MKRRPAHDAEARRLSRFKREVTALIIARGYSAPNAKRVVERWRKYVAKRWKDGRPPCSVSDHLMKFERENLVKPATDKKRFRLSKPEFHRVMRKRSRSKTRHSRDAENPKVGEIFESRNGTRWEVVGVTENRVDVRRAGHRSSGPLRWAKSVIKTLKGKPVRHEEAVKDARAEVPAPRPTLFESLLKGSKPANETERDPQRRFRGKGKRRRSKKRY